MRLASLLALVVIAQMVLGVRVLLRLGRSAGGRPIRPVSSDVHLDETVTVVVPVLDERDRLAPCLDGLVAQGSEVCEILVVDGGSSDGTQDLVETYVTRDPRVRLLDASPLPGGWNGKAWGLQVGLERAASESHWLLTIDADVRPSAQLTRSLLAHACATGLSALSVATKQEIRGAGEGLLHPSMLTTLVYRFGIPGRATRRVPAVQANGQCFLARRDLLESVGGFAAVRDSICEDVTLARRIAESGSEVGFFEAGDMVTVRMYPTWRATWQDWSRSLPMRDRYFGVSGVLGLAEVILVQALPLPLLAALRLTNRGRVPGWMVAVNIGLVAARLGVLFGTARAYLWRPWSYWLSPLVDVPVAIKLVSSALQRRHIWRGHALVRGGDQ